MAIDRQTRTDLRNALVDYMTGAIRAFSFADRSSACRNADDRSVQVISRELYCMYDDCIDHPISVTSDGWEALRRAVAFLGTDLEIGSQPSASFWPFADERQWHANEHLVDEVGLPDYDPLVHGRPANPWWNRIPSSIGFLILAGIVVAVFVAVALS